MSKKLEKIRMLHEQGKSDVEISIILNISRATVQRIRSSMGLTSYVFGRPKGSKDKMPRRSHNEKIRIRFESDYYPLKNKTCGIKDELIPLLCSSAYNFNSDGSYTIKDKNTKPGDIPSKVKYYFNSLRPNS